MVEHRTFNSYVQSPKPIPEPVERFTGVYNSYLVDAPVLADIYEQFVQFTEGCVLVTHAGYEFDLPLLRMECERNNLKMLSNRCLDTKALFTYLYPDNPNILTTNYLVHHYGIDDSSLKRHDALDDSKLIAKLFLRLLEEFKARNINDFILDKPIQVRRFEIIPMV
ncbi:DNA polymerase III epsilon subunit-like protein [Paenibacillus phyllosphaerae]|uniref:DNA polymerase III epsilon subunit-like protein n=1 Tax=Paenibacillus phyllosphaerae TaxID=274593 RepID=A0A7W5AWH7_9BACL|nr:DNA polymerase III epsilon subunit-like protein [Paenibacillus phyllosphaerae]